MARMHSRKKGKSGSKKPVKKSVPSWARYKAKEVELLVAKFGKEGKSSSEIGIILRDTYGVPDVRTTAGKKIQAILKERGLQRELPEDLLNLVKKSINLRKHMGENKQDMPAKRGLQLTESKIKRLGKDYKRTKGLALDWKYDAKSIRLYAE